jgi:hypothetical protein
MTAQTVGAWLAAHDYVSHVMQDVTIAGIQSLVICFCKIDFIILKQIVTGDKVVGIRQAG